MSPDPKAMTRLNSAKTLIAHGAKALVQSLMIKIRHDRRLGVTQKKRQYDLPLERSSGTNFLMLLIALMTFLIIISLISSLGLNRITSTWTQGLANRATIEIPAEKSNGDLRTPEQIASFTNQVVTILDGKSYIDTFTVMSHEDIAALITPWLGHDLILNDIPLPQLISVTFQSRSEDALNDMTKELALINDNLRLDTHENWLDQLLKLTQTFQFAGFLVVVIIALTTITAVAGGVRSRMAIYRADIELLHLMGASDEYITKQFQRHAVLISAKGATSGALGALLILILISTLEFANIASIPNASTFNLTTIGVLILTPIAACALSVMTARTTVLRELAQMP